MITVYVWSAKSAGGQKNVGHASMLVHGHAYVSWWPDQTAGLVGDFHPIRNKSYQSDVQDEGCYPDHKIDISGLNEPAVLDWWAALGLMRDHTMLQGPLLPYNLLQRNCSTVVATGLKRGGADQYAGWYSSWSIVWRPETVLHYALAIKKGLHDKA